MLFSNILLSLIGDECKDKASTSAETWDRHANPGQPTQASQPVGVVVSRLTRYNYADWQIITLRHERFPCLSSCRVDRRRI